MGRIKYAVQGRRALWDDRPLAAWVPDIVHAVKDAFDPEQIILFGSVARGTDGPDSDIDLLVVFQDADPGRRRQLMTELRRATRHIAAPHDLVVTDVNTLMRDHERPGTIEYEALTSGTVVYERQTN